MAYASDGLCSQWPLLNTNYAASFPNHLRAAQNVQSYYNLSHWNPNQGPPHALNSFDPNGLRSRGLYSHRPMPSTAHALNGLHSKWPMPKRPVLPVAHLASPIISDCPKCPIKVQP